jgi:hypothetical protein
MRAERDALLKLVQALRREYEAVQLAKEAQHDELRSLKDKMTVKVRVNRQASCTHHSQALGHFFSRHQQSRVSIKLRSTSLSAR